MSGDLDKVAFFIASGHSYDSQCFCKFCVEEDVRLRLYAQADDLDDAKLRERFAVIPKVYR